MDRQVAIDAGLALLVLAGTFVLLGRTETHPSAVGFAAGAGSVLVVEWLVAPWRTPIRRAWARSVVQLLGLAAVMAALVVAWRFFPEFGLSFAASAASAYLLLVVLVEAGMAPPPGTWWHPWNNGQ